MSTKVNFSREEFLIWNCCIRGESMDGKTIDQVAVELGVNKSTLRATLSRHPELRPSGESKYGWSYVWTDEKIEELRRYYATKTSIGNPRGKAKD